MNTGNCYHPDYNAIIAMELPTAEYRESGGTWTIGHFVRHGPGATQKYRTAYKLQQRWLIRKGKPYLAEYPLAISDYKLVHNPYGTYHTGGKWTPIHVFCAVEVEWRNVEEVPSLMGDVLY